MKELYNDACVKTGVDTVGIAAVGSWGRGAVALRSDADVRVVVAPRTDGRQALAFVDALLYPLWDAGMPLGHQVVNEEDVLALAQDDLSTATALLDLRHVAGDPARVTSLLERAWAGLFAEGAMGAFAARLEEETATRHERFGRSVYLLEPDVKSGAGGLRDLDGARWVARARFHVAGLQGSDGAGAASEGVWQELVRLGVLVPREAQEIALAEEFLWRVRNRLHAHAGRRSDRLTFDEQEAIAIELGFGREGQERAPAAEAFMQEYYLHARAVTRGRERVFDRAVVAKRRAKPTEVDLGQGVRLFDGHVTLAGTQELQTDPALALRVFRECIRHVAPIHSYARSAIARAAADPAWAEGLRALPEAAAIFVELVCSVAEARARRGSIVAELHEVGLVLAMIPEFLPVTGRVHHDVYHVYTVDVHSVAAVDCLRALARGELAHEHPLASRLAAEIARPRPLFLATLLHDVGKGFPDATGSRKNHSASGAQLCERILPRLGLAHDDIAPACALVAQHLSMYHVATRRDLDDPSTVVEFCRAIPDRETLRDLYLLTVADISTTSPTAMTSWKARMLEELFIAADAYLAGNEGFDDARAVNVRSRARELLEGSSAFLDEFMASMPDRYLLANTPEAIVAHARVAQAHSKRAGEGSRVEAARVPSRHGDAAEICVVADDRPGLLASIAAAITASRLEVLAAQVYSRAKTEGHGVEAVDLFWVRDRNDGAEGVARSLKGLARDLDDVCAGRVDAATLLHTRMGSSSPWRERPSPAVATEVVVDDRASPRHTVIEVFAKDRPGLLYTLSRALHELGLQIALSKINTEGTKVADVFYVSELDGSKALPGERFKAIRDGLLAALEWPIGRSPMAPSGNP